MGGSQYQAKLLIEELHNNHDVSISYFAARTPERRELPDHQVVCTGWSDFLRRFGHFWDYFRLQKALREFAPDVIYQRVCCSYTGIAANFSSRAGVPMVWHIASANDCSKAPHFWSSLRRPHAWLETRLAKSGILRADVIVAQTEDQSRMLEENFGRRPDRVIRNFHPQPRASSKPTNPLTVVWIANFKPLKRPELFLDIASFLEEIPGIEFLMVGQPYFSRSLRNEFKSKLNRISNVKCLGEMAQGDVNTLLDRTHLLVNTSRWEGFSNTFIQAWMRAVPVLTLGVNPDQVLDNNGLGFSYDSAAEIADSIRELTANPDMLKTMGEQARQFALQHFSMKNAAELANLIVESAASRQQPHAGK
jgi:glycosyltransferase involved in cell wall biosynthesis